MSTKNLKFKKAFFEYLSGCGLKESTIKRTRVDMKKFYVWLNGRDVRDITKRGIQGFLKYLSNQKSQRNRKLSDNTKRICIISIKSFFTFLFKNEYIITNPLEDILIRRAKDKKERKIFTQDEIGAFLDSISLDDENNQRDRALYELFYSSGLRMREAFNLEVENINFNERVLIVKQGKGGKDRYVPFSETALKFIIKYINDGRKEHLMEHRDMRFKKYLFLTHKGKVNQGVMEKRFKKHLENCGLKGKGFTMYSIRHSTATHLLENGASIRYVSELLGHESIRTTQVYTRPTVENIKKVYRTFHPRENEYYDEIDGEYLKQLNILKERLIEEKEKKRKKRLKMSS